MRIEPIYDGMGTAVTRYNIIDNSECMIFTGSYEECINYLETAKKQEDEHK